MAKSNTRLELTWIGKENRPKLEPRILLEDASKSYHGRSRVTEHDLFDNRLVFGHNLPAELAMEEGLPTTDGTHGQGKRRRRQTADVALPLFDQ